MIMTPEKHIQTDRGDPLLHPKYNVFLGLMTFRKYLRLLWLVSKGRNLLSSSSSTIVDVFMIKKTAYHSWNPTTSSVQTGCYPK